MNAPTPADERHLVNVLLEANATDQQCAYAARLLMEESPAAAEQYVERLKDRKRLQNALDGMGATRAARSTAWQAFDGGDLSTAWDAALDCEEPKVRAEMEAGRG